MHIKDKLQYIYIYSAAKITIDHIFFIILLLQIHTFWYLSHYTYGPSVFAVYRDGADEHIEAWK